MRLMNKTDGKDFIKKDFSRNAIKASSDGKLTGSSAPSTVTLIKNI